VSDDGATGLVVIGMLGNVFSPAYAASRRRDARPEPLDFCTMNVALYGRDGDAFALTERKRHEVFRTEDELVIGRSVMRWRDGALEVDLDERRAPFGGRIRGRVRLQPGPVLTHHAVLDAQGRHHWWPVTVNARAEVELDEPGLRFSGNAYHDVNAGDEGLEDGFSSWSWSRGNTRSGAVVAYDVTRRGGERASLGVRVDRSGVATPMPESEWSTLPGTLWRIDRRTRSDRGGRAKLLRTLEDTPFYARSLVESELCGERVRAVHEVVDLERFASSWVRFLLPFRMHRNDP
jgi:carotenoid 1,2-hydratase